MPYAYGAIIKHEYIDDHIEIYLIFHHQMLRSFDYSADPVVYDVFPPLGIWNLLCDDVDISIIDNEWVDDFTLKLTSDSVGSRPTQVTLEYAGPNEYLSFRWGKQIEPFGPSHSTDLTATLWLAGMIILWSGAVVDIPSGWHLCDGDNDTPDLRDKFVIGAGNLAPGTTGGASTHTHTATQTPHYHELASIPTVMSTGPFKSHVTDSKQPAITVVSQNHLPPYYALCYIMKL
jgi:hypothetical protein